MNTNQNAFSLHIAHITRGRGKIFMEVCLEVSRAACCGVAPARTGESAAAAAARALAELSSRMSFRAYATSASVAATASTTSTTSTSAPSVFLPCECIDITTTRDMCAPMHAGVSTTHRRVCVKRAVCVLSVFTSTQTLVVEALETSKTHSTNPPQLVCRTHKTLHAEVVKRIGQLNTLVHNAHAAAIRNIDARGMRPGARIDLLEIRPRNIAEKTTEELLLYVELPCLGADEKPAAETQPEAPEPQPAAPATAHAQPTLPPARIDMNTPCMLALYNEAGELITTEYRVLSDGTQLVGSNHRAATRTMIVSFAAPAPARAYCVWAYTNTPYAQLAGIHAAALSCEQSSFVTFEDFYVADVRRASAARTQSAADDKRYPQWFMQHACTKHDTLCQRESYERLCVRMHTQYLSSDTALTCVVWADAFLGDTKDAACSSNDAPASFAHADTDAKPNANLDSVVAAALRTLLSIEAQTLHTATVVVVCAPQLYAALSQACAYIAHESWLSGALCVHAFDSAVQNRYEALLGTIASMQANHSDSVDARHSYCLQLFAGDVLSVDALYWYATAISKHPGLQAVYCDEDAATFSAYGQLTGVHHPYFKPDWDSTLLAFTPYVSHGLAVSLDVLQQTGEVLQHVSDVLQQTVRTHPSVLVHAAALLIGSTTAAFTPHAMAIPQQIRRVLYHAQAPHPALCHPASSQLSAYATLVSELRTQYLQTIDQLRAEQTEQTAQTAQTSPLCTITCTVASDGTRTEHYTWHRQPLVSIIIPTKDAIDVLSRCITSIYAKTTWPYVEVILVENNSTNDATFAYYKTLQAAHNNLRVCVCKTGGVFNFSRVVNAGAAAAKGEYLLFLNNDTEVITPNWIERLLSTFAYERVGIAGAKLLFANNTIQHEGVVLGSNLWSPQHVYSGIDAAYEGYAHMNVYNHEQHAVTGACMMMPRRVYDECGTFDESLPVNFNDTDVCLRVRAHGYTVVQRSDTQLYHHESVSRGHADNPARLERLMFDFGTFWTRWSHVLRKSDPWYSENFGYNNIYCGLDAMRRF